MQTTHSYDGSTTEMRRDNTETIDYSRAIDHARQLRSAELHALAQKARIAIRALYRRLRRKATPQRAPCAGRC